MNTDIAKLKKEFERIKQKGWVKSIGGGNNAIGDTLEYLLGIPRNELEIPDYNSIEIKSKNLYSKEYITLFSCAPEGPHVKEIERIRNLYGYKCRDLPKCKVLNNSIFANCKTKIGLQYYFELKIDRENQKLLLYVFDINGKLIEKDIYWTLDTIKEKLYRKLTILAFFKALKKKYNGVEYFKYYKLELYSLKDFETFIDLMEKGLIRVSFKINVFKSGKRKGQIHDHGTGFQISEKKLLELYNEI